MSSHMNLKCRLLAAPWSSVSVTVPSVRNLNGTKTSAPVTKSVLLKAAQGVIENANEFEVRRLYILVRVDNRGTMILVR